MRKWLTLLLLLGCAWPAMAAKPMTVEQVEQMLVKLQGKPDTKAARGLDEIQLTERVSRIRLARWQASFPGSDTRQQLLKMADMSAFFGPPASDVIPDPPPDPDTQRHMLWMAEQYVRSAMSRLPDLFATRETTHFEAKSAGDADLADSAKSLQWTGVDSRTVTYRDGHEVPFASAGKQPSEPALGLTTQGEFGPILSQVLSDALEGQVSFEHWEQGADDPAAVFHYAIPINASHFELAIATGNQMPAVHPAYHGEIEIDPETGAILRLSEIADMPPPRETERAAIEVEYAPVTIGDRSYICPVDSVAFSMIAEPDRSAGSANRGAADQKSWFMQIHLNDVTVTHYREVQSQSSVVVSARPAGETGGERP